MTSIDVLPASFTKDGCNYTRQATTRSKKGLYTWYYNCSSYRVTKCPAKLTIKERDDKSLFETQKKDHNCSRQHDVTAVPDITEIEKDYITTQTLKTLQKRPLTIWDELKEWRINNYGNQAIRGMMKHQVLSFVQAECAKTRIQTLRTEQIIHWNDIIERSKRR
jgi:hypothetical protein